MANTTAALDFQKASSILRQMQDCLSNIHKVTNNSKSAFDAALEKSTEQKWMVDIVSIEEGILKQCIEVSEACDTCVDGLRKYDEDMRDFANSGIGADV